jgi:phosphoadenosine phosphosulfate reductase
MKPRRFGGAFDFLLLALKKRRRHHRTRSKEAHPILTTASPTIETAAQTLHWALRTYRERIVLAATFGGLGGMVLLDIALRIEPKLPVYYLDTGLLFPETYAFIRSVEERYGIAVVAVAPELSVDDQARAHGDALWQRDPDACCDLRKVRPQREFLKQYDAWITGLHRTTMATRRDVQRVAWDARSNVVKVSPLALWSDDDLTVYAREREIPHNPLLDAGYASIGCVPCTRRVRPGEDPRAGRWAGFDKTECGLHVPPATSTPARTPLRVVRDEPAGTPRH